eukprot:m.58291 g.58291  ORF g.58291 m.58291 type:complete len:53 (-) comp22527_c0_seq1:109-267(-)
MFVSVSLLVQVLSFSNPHIAIEFWSIQIERLMTGVNNDQPFIYICIPSSPHT